MKSVAMTAGLIGLIVSGCVVAQPRPGASLPEMNYSGLADQVAFEHGCAPERIRVIRSAPMRLVMDLDVCGVVRRYKLFGDAAPVTWLDVTSLYPASSIPPPLPAGWLPPPAPAKRQGAEEGADGMMQW